MKKRVMTEKTFCDVCASEAYGYDMCIVCGKDFCLICVGTDAVKFTHAVHSSGSGDGIYCLSCHFKAESNGDILHAAYRRIEALKHEESSFYDDYIKRAKEAEKDLKRIQLAI